VGPSDKTQVAIESLGGNPRKRIEPEASHAGTRNGRWLFNNRDASYHISYRLRHQIRDRGLDGGPSDAA
jgi:hypothetical protein